MPGKNGQFLGQDFIQSGGIQQQRQILMNCPPIFLNFFLDVQFLEP